MSLEKYYLKTVFIAIALLFAVPATAGDFDLSGEPTKGPANAPVRIVLFYDFQCGHCAKTTPVLLEVLPLYGDLVQFVPVNVPSPGNAYAEPSAELALTANDKGKFWDIMPKIFANQSKLSPEFLVQLGKEVGLDEKTVAENLKTHKHRDLIKRDFYQAVNNGISATPTMFINDEKIVGDQTADTFKYYINLELEKKGIRSPVAAVAKPKEEQKSYSKQVPPSMIYSTGVLPPTDSKLKVKVGDAAPDFMLPTLTGEKVRLSSYKGKKNVVLSFVPAAWTPVCSGQWPEYNEYKADFDAADTVLIGLAVDNIPALYSWCTSMGDLWFTVASDFYPHGKVAATYGVLRSTGTSERAVFLIDKKGVIRYIDVHDINSRPDYGTLKNELQKLSK